MDSDTKEFRDSSIMLLRFHDRSFDGSLWNRFNIPIWFLHQEGFTFVRTYAPRLNIGITDVIEGEVEVPAPAVDVKPFHDEMD